VSCRSRAGRAQNDARHPTAAGGISSLGHGAPSARARRHRAATHPALNRPTTHHAADDTAPWRSVNCDRLPNTAMPRIRRFTEGEAQAARRYVVRSNTTAPTAFRRIRAKGRPPVSTRAFACALPAHIVAGAIWLFLLLRSFDWNSTKTGFFFPPPPPPHITTSPQNKHSQSYYDCNRTPTIPQR